MKRLITFFCVLVSVQTFATVRLVPVQYATIQSALNAARAGDTILVSAGVYHENIIWPQTNNLHLLGEGGKKLLAIIDGSGTGRVIDIEYTGKTSLKAEIKGLTIQNGFIDVPAHQGGKGAGILVSNAEVQLSDCFIINNTITSSAAIQNSGFGGGAYFENTPAGFINLISNCVFSSNIIAEVTNGSGGAIGFDNAPTKIINAIINHNKMSVEEVGIGTVYAYASSLKLGNVKIEDNKIITNENVLAGQAVIKGGAIFAYISPVAIENLLADNNLLTPFNASFALLGSGIYYYGEGAGLKISNSTIANNKRTDGAPVNGTGIYFSSSDGRAATVVNSVLWNADNGPEIYNQTKKMIASYSDIRNGYAGTANINSDPQFISSSDFHLQLSSPCINAGNNDYAPQRDLEGNKRPEPIGSNTDPGCYEMNQPTLISAQKFEKENEPVVIYPNPSRSAFKVVVPETLIGAQLQISNSAGNILVNRKVSSTETAFSFDKWQKGIYFITLNKGSAQKVLNLIIEK